MSTVLSVALVFCKFLNEALRELYGDGSIA